MMIHLLHGAAGSPADWTEFAPLLLPRCSHARDLLGGEIGALDAFGGQLNRSASPGDILLGYSMGGRLALHALLAPDPPWAAAVIVSAHTGLETDAERDARRAADLQWARRAREDWPGFLAAWEAQPLFATAARRPDRPALEGRSEAVALSFENWSLGRQRNLLPELERVSCPVLWLAGDRDGKFTAIAERACERLPDAQLEIVEGAGHRLPWDQPEAAAARIGSFLSRRIV